MWIPFNFNSEKICAQNQQTSPQKRQIPHSGKSVYRHPIKVKNESRELKPPVHQSKFEKLKTALDRHHKWKRDPSNESRYFLETTKKPHKPDKKLL